MTWLPKLVAQHAKAGGVDFSHEEKIALHLGMGVNMVKSLRYWAYASGCLERDGSLTDFAAKIFDLKTGYDPYLEKGETLWALHWNMCKSREKSSMIWWMFNKWQRTRFTMQQTLDGLREYLLNALGERVPAAGTLKSDVETVMRMYAIRKDHTKFPDVDETLFPHLNLLREAGESREHVYERITSPSREVPLPALAYAIASYAQQYGKPSKREKRVEVSSLCHSFADAPALGASFGFTEDRVNESLELLERIKGTIFGLEYYPDGAVLVLKKNITPINALVRF